jgi:hypothetical protein
VATLVDYLAGEMLSTSDVIESKVAEQIIPESNFDDLSDSEAEALLLSKLASMRY